MAAESIWLGMFRAEAGSGTPTSVMSTTDKTGDTVASYAISDEQGTRKGPGQLAMKRSKQDRYE
jgi:hypothetical protein